MTNLRSHFLNMMVISSYLSSTTNYIVHFELSFNKIFERRKKECGKEEIKERKRGKEKKRERQKGEKKKGRKDVRGD